MKKLITIAFVVLLAFPVALAYLSPDSTLNRPGGPQRFNEYFFDPRVQRQEFSTVVYLTPPKPPIFARGYPPYYPRGTARIESVRSPYTPRVHVVVDTKDLRSSSNDNTYYQAWLYDSDSGGFMNLGAFEVTEGNVGDLDYASSHYVDVYDYVLVTREKRDDTDPRPSNEEVLIGKITHQPYTAYLPTPLLGERAQFGYTYNQ